MKRLSSLVCATPTWTRCICFRPSFFPGRVTVKLILTALWNWRCWCLWRGLLPVCATLVEGLERRRCQVVSIRQRQRLGLQAGPPKTLMQITLYDYQGPQACTPAVAATFGGLCGPGLLCILISLSACWPDYFLDWPPRRIR
ncbi:hypothetical protein ALP06_100632 [Pseudomonas coronafaciens pv. atropurpurea]|nr:hypothetical protein ALO38_100330 [Pseudomonas coronafaciens pv. zizaniae]RMV69788.1 hypothetical protein ALP06_100632 [Pseudomonas coronafaciens pv. atropurpurea]